MLEFERHKVAETRDVKNAAVEKLDLLQKEWQVHAETIKLTAEPTMLEQCLKAIKDSMVLSFRFVDFYKDIQAYVASNMFDNETDQHL
jgi:hypothetical protein